MLRFSCFLFLIFFNQAFGGSEYYYSNGEKVFLDKKAPISRSDNSKNCYSHIDINDYICLENEIIISMNEDNLQPILDKYKLVFVKKLMKNLFLVKTNQHKKSLSITNDIHEEDIVNYAYPNFENTIKFRSATTPIVTTDPYGKYSWHLKNTSQGHQYKLGADIKVEEAWRNNKGLAIKVGMIDDGIEVSHPDVVYTDGYSVSNPTARNPDHYASNSIHHGTKAASLIVGKSNNVGGLGVAPEAFLYIVNVDGSPKVSDLVSAFNWLKEKEVDVISNSWGSYKVPTPIVTVVKDILKTGRKGRGTPVVFAVGNDSKDLDVAGVDDESEIEGVISVAASTPFDNRYIKSNFGKSLTLVAPGVDLIVARQDTTKKQIDFTNISSLTFTTEEQLYVKETGTSFSAPIVAAGIALMINANKQITSSAIKEILQNTSDKIATNEYSYDVDGRNNYYGYGRLNLGDAVRAASVWSDDKNLNKDDVFTLDIQKGWNLISIPVNKVIYQKDFKKYFGFGYRLIKLEDNVYNHYAKVVFPRDGFYLYSQSATKVNFKGKDYNVSFGDVPINEGWNLLGAGRDTNVSVIRSQITNTDYVYFYRKGKFITSYNDGDKINRGDGFFLYKLE